MTPIEAEDGNISIVSGLYFKCPQCHTENLLSFPAPKIDRTGKITLFGDEAFEWRESPTALLYVISFVGMNEDFKSKIQDMMTATKLKIRPQDDPGSWPFHVIGLRDKRWRLKHGVQLSIGDINNAINELASALEQPSYSRFIAACLAPTTGPGSRRFVEARAREITLMGAITSITDYLTDLGLNVDFILEAQTDAHKRNEIDISVEKVGRALRHDLAFLYACKTKLIGLPTTAPKGETLELEIADLVAYMVRRYFHCWRINKKTEFPLESLGRIFWGAFTRNMFLTYSGFGFPWEYFYPEAKMGKATL